MVIRVGVFNNGVRRALPLRLKLKEEAFLTSGILLAEIDSLTFPTASRLSLCKRATCRKGELTAGREMFVRLTTCHTTANRLFKLAIESGVSDKGKGGYILYKSARKHMILQDSTLL